MKHEDLIQRFIDQELSAAERVRFVLALGRDAELRGRVLELEQLAMDAANLPRPVVPPGFAARVLKQATALPSASVVSPPPPRLRQGLAGALRAKADGFSRTEIRTSTWRRALDAFWAPRAFRWNLAGAAAFAVVLLAVGAVLATTLKRPAPMVAQSPTPQERRVVLVRLVVVQPGAHAVQAAGDFNGWNPTRTPLEQTSDGAWTATLPLEPGRYEYQFVVDGERWIGDPFAAEQSDDGFGSRNAVLDVRPPAETVGIPSA